MQRYTTKHLWRMTESEQGEWVRYEDYKEETEILRMERDSYRELYKQANMDHCDMTLHYYEEQRLSNRYKFLVDFLSLALIITYVVIVGRLIWLIL
jgi:hypothetical protein